MDAVLGGRDPVRRRDLRRGGALDERHRPDPGGSRRRFKRLLPAFDAVGPEDVPTTISRTRTRARMSLEQRDIKPAQGAVTKLENVIEHIGMSSDLATIRRSLNAQRNLVHRKGSVLGRQVINREEQLLRGLKNTKEAGLADAAVRASEAVTHVLSIEALMRHVCATPDPSAAPADSDAERKALELLGKFAGNTPIKEVWQQYQAEIAALPAVDEMTERDPEPPHVLVRPFSAAPTLLRKLRRRMVHFADVRNVVVFFAAVLVTFIGLESQFFGDTGFDGGVRNYLQMFAWAAAIQIVGVEVAQLGSQLYGRRAPPEGLQPQG